MSTRSHRAYSYFLDPPKILAGSMMMDFNNWNTASTVMPIRRKGRRRIQTIGYKRRARRASGQQNTNKRSQSKNLVKVDPPY
jgi:hypothetical protein